MSAIYSLNACVQYILPTHVCNISSQCMSAKYTPTHVCFSQWLMFNIYSQHIYAIFTRNSYVQYIIRTNVCNIYSQHIICNKYFKHKCSIYSQQIGAIHTPKTSLQYILPAHACNIYSKHMNVIHIPNAAPLSP